MHKSFPVSLLGLVATAVVFLLQVVPIIGFFLMVVAAPFWSVLLINGSMIGVAIEVAVGRVARFWLLLPILFYGGYWLAATSDHLALWQLRSQYDAANAKVAVDFEPTRHALVFQNSDAGAWLTQNYALPVAYSINSNFPEGYRSNRMVDFSVCTTIRKYPNLIKAAVVGLGFFDGNIMLGNRRMEERFCDLSMPERPTLPIVLVAGRGKETFVRGMPVTLGNRTITMPDGQIFQLLGGMASPLTWIPMPIMGCGLDSLWASWDCSVRFQRNRFVPIVSGSGRFGRDSVVLAKALGLKPVTIDDRVGADRQVVFERIAEIEKASAKAAD